MDSLRSMNNALEYIEEHLTEEIDYSEVSKIAYCSEYHFKRMFSFLGVSFQANVFFFSRNKFIRIYSEKKTDVGCT